MFGLNLFDKCVSLIRHWQPKQKYKVESQYRDDLFNFLHKNLNTSNFDLFGFNRPTNILLKKESGRGLCDIGVGPKNVGIELKKNLRSKSQINRLQGQIDDYKEEYIEGVIVVLVGNIDSTIESELRYKLSKKINYGFYFNSAPFRIKLINKTSASSD